MGEKRLYEVNSVYLIVDHSRGLFQKASRSLINIY